jgi:hypothetical protein
LVKNQRDFRTETKDIHLINQDVPLVIFIYMFLHKDLKKNSAEENIIERLQGIKNHNEMKQSDNVLDWKEKRNHATDGLFFELRKDAVGIIKPSIPRKQKSRNTHRWTSP